ncbi:MAG: carbohydrate kinase family protein [Patescibacteria group bacterium]
MWFKNKKIDFLAIGDTVIDAFIKLTDADRPDIRGVPDHEDYKICLPYAEKIPYEEVYVVNAVGNAANAAVSAARLGLQTALVTNLGDDQNGRDCLESLGKDGVRTDFVKINRGIKTNYHYVLWYKSERTILIKHEKYSYTLPNIGTPKWIYFSSVSKDSFPFHNTVADYLEKHPDVKLAFQPGKNEINLGKEKLARLYKRADIFFCNVEEARTILGSQAENVLELSREINKLGPKIVAISDGPNGAYLYFKENNEYKLWKMPIYPDIAPPLERTGAGDAFSSTVVAALALGKSPLEALTWGPINSMSVVQEIGAQKGLLTKEKLLEYLTKAPADYKPKEI